MMIPALWFISCSVVCLLGFVVGRCFQDFNGIALTQELITAESERDAALDALADYQYMAEQFQVDLEDLAARYKEKKSDDEHAEEDE